MNQKILILSFFCYPQLNSYIIFFFFSVLTRITFGSSQNPEFEACHPQTCGNNQNINYPFYIRGKQKPLCGYPGFDLLCSDDGFPILNLSNADYIIQEIFYHNRSLRVTHRSFSSSGSINCLPPPSNLTLNGNKFRLVPKQKNLFLLYGCESKTVSHRLQAYDVRCSEENVAGSVVALYKEDRNLSYALNNCDGEVVTTTVEGESEDIGEALRRGFLLAWTAADCTECNRTGGKCGFDYGVYTFQCYCPDRAHFKHCIPPPPPEKRSQSSKLGLGLGLGIGVFVTLVISILIIWLCKRKYASSKVQFHSRDSSYSNSDPETGSAYFGIPVFSYKELEEATNNFDSARELGDGGFGTVYYGKLQDGKEVAVKRLYEHNYRRVEQFMNEVKILTRLRHKNLVSLYGCTSHQSQDLLLVYEYIPNGTIASHLHGDLAKPGLLPWAVRMKIAIETATALAYLHATEIIHRDVKTNNILLDNSYCVKVADFGLSRLFPNNVTHVSTAPQGTPGYVDPEYHQYYQLTSKSDVYSFGVVLIELISSMPAVDMSRHKDEINLSNLAIKKIQKSAFSELVDPYLGFESDNEVKRMIISVAELAFQCLQSEKELRPSMDEVLVALKRIERGEDEPEQPEEEDIHGAGISHSNSVQRPPLPCSPDWDEVGLLKNMKLPPSPNTVTDKWESESTTPYVSG